jgi:hypothetical protein
MLPMSRRNWLSVTMGSGCAVLLWSRRSEAAQINRLGLLENRIGNVIREYEQQGFHRTGTSVDGRSGDWLCEEVHRIGLVPVREAFSMSRIDLIDTHLIAGNRRIEGLPLFDAQFTQADGIRGRIGPIDSDAEIGLTEAAPNTAAAGALGEARRQNRHKAIVCVTRGGRPGLCPNNADSFLNPFGPPVLQISSEESSFLTEIARQQGEVRLVARVKRTRATSFNVIAKIDGHNGGLAPLVVMTPRSGWYTCASERGGGIACWLELMRTLRYAQPTRDVLFVASSGHELGHLGIDVFVKNRPGIVSTAIGWIHLGASIGAATGSGNTIQASDDQFEALLSHAITLVDLTIVRRNPRGTVPGGEAEVVHRGGGRYVSVIGSNALFHNPDDRGPRTVELGAISRFTKAFETVAQMLIAS